MTRDEYLRELQRRIAVAKGYTDLRDSRAVQLRAENVAGPGNLTIEPIAHTVLQGTLHTDEGPTRVPRWSWDWCEAGELVAEMTSDPYSRSYECLWTGGYEDEAYQFRLHIASFGRGITSAQGWTAAEAIARCWCAWKGVDLSDLPTVAP